MILKNYFLVLILIMTIKLAQWPAPANVHAFSTTKLSGVSRAPYESNNLGLHVGDDEISVLHNRQRIREEFGLPNEPIWLNQTHSTRCIKAEIETDRNADAAISSSSKHPLVILTADCLPIVLCNQQGTEIAAVHAGWRGLFHGILANTISCMQSNPMNLMAWIGPAICQSCYEVGEEVYSSFTNKYPLSQNAFAANKKKWHANLPKIAEIILNNLGVSMVFQSNLCTFELKDEFYSYRREPQTGRIGTFIWLNNHSED